jgi:hypothetical protein
MGADFSDRIEPVVTLKEAALVDIGKVIIGSEIAKASTAKAAAAKAVFRDVPDPAHEVVQKLAAAFESHHEQLTTEVANTHLGITASKTVIEGTRKTVGNKYAEVTSSFAAGLQEQAEHPEYYVIPFEERVNTGIHKLFETNPAHKALWLKPQVHELAADHMGDEMAAIVHNIVSPEIAAEAAAAANQHEASLAAAAKAAVTTVSKSGGKSGWVTAGVGAAVIGLGAIALLRNQKKEVQQGLSDPQLAR